MGPRWRLAKLALRLVEGDVRHRDSLDNYQIIRPGQLNLMTAGRGIAHAEQSTEPGGMLHGVRLWVALLAAAAGTVPTSPTTRRSRR